ncbi:MAG TPA: PAS domain-containing protein, partial [Armatimonadota bacterium]
MSPEMSSVDRLKTRIPTGKGYLVAIAVGGLALLLAHFLLPILVHRRAAVSLWTLLVALAILLLLGLLFLVFSRAYAQAVHAATTRYAALLDSADAAVFLLALQPDGTPECILEANSLARQRAGYSVEALADLSPSALIAVEYAEEFRQLFAELATRGQALLETVAVAQDGQRTPVEVFARLTTSNKSQAFL